MAAARQSEDYRRLAADDRHDGELCLIVDAIFAEQRSVFGEAGRREFFRQIELESVTTRHRDSVPFVLARPFFIEEVHVEQDSLAVGRDRYRRGRAQRSEVATGEGSFVGGKERRRSEAAKKESAGDPVQPVACLHVSSSS